MPSALQAFDEMLDAFRKDRLSKDDFKEAVKMIVAKLDKRMNDEKEELRQGATAIAEAFTQLRSDFENSMNEKDSRLSSSEKAALDRIESKIADMEAMVSARLAELKDGEEGAPGLDADEEAVAAKVYEQISASLPALKEELRNGLELIDNEEEKLSIDAISGLRKELDELKKRPATFGAIGHIQRLSERILDAAETPDGIITAFTFATKPSAVIVNGSRYRENKGWTWTNNQAVLDFAPATGSDVWSEL